MSAVPSSPPRAGDDEYAGSADDRAYARFLAAVVAAQVRSWLPAEPARVLDISSSDTDRGSAGLPAALRRTGHSVVRVLPELPGDRRIRSAGGPSHVVGDPRSLDWFQPGCVDALLAEGSTLSSCLATEDTVREAARVLRPGGRMLLSVDSLLFGLARLAEQHRWPELADAGAADVVLVPAPGGRVTRCFGPEELSDLVTDAGFDVAWVRPRTAIPPDVIRHALSNDAGTFDELVASELGLAQERQGEAPGMYLALSAVRR